MNHFSIYELLWLFLIYSFAGWLFEMCIRDRVYIGDEGYTQVREKPDIDRILNDLGYSANDLMNVSCV